MKKDKIDILVTFDTNYIKPFQTMLKSLVINNQDEIFHIWLLHSAIPQGDLQTLEEFCSLQRVSLTPIRVDRALFQNAPVLKQYPQEMYYRLLAPILLPDSLEKILYLDPDMLIINPVRPLWEMKLNHFTFAAASHGDILDIINHINRIRLGKKHDYFNSGVMLMDLKKARHLICAEDIFDCVREHAEELLLPDQDVFNFLYGEYTLPLADEIWNYDARYFTEYRLRSSGLCSMDWIMQNTVVLHFCGKQKPWKRTHSSRFTSLYKHYMTLTFR